uniref:Uncharacterized protein n=1 Tax=Trypanosoma vivax (strain Y486) TaxID=1055687 RepID=G0U684_TRYVY|nr:hypothetical protein TVY486_1004380 [Trypanosoma vivax Y486]
MCQGANQGGGAGRYGRLMHLFPSAISAWVGPYWQAEKLRGRVGGGQVGCRLQERLWRKDDWALALLQCKSPAPKQRWWRKYQRGVGIAGALPHRKVRRRLFAAVHQTGLPSDSGHNTTPPSV